jgi:hypothetical protein
VPPLQVVELPQGAARLPLRRDRPLEIGVARADRVSAGDDALQLGDPALRDGDPPVEALRLARVLVAATDRLADGLLAALRRLAAGAGRLQLLLDRAHRLLPRDHPGGEGGQLRLRGRPPGQLGGDPVEGRVDLLAPDLRLAPGGAGALLQRVVAPEAEDVG